MQTDACATVEERPFRAAFVALKEAGL